MPQFTHADGSVFVARDQVDGILIDPELPENFDDTPNNKRSPAHMRWWGMPFIVTQSVEDWDARYATMSGENAETARQHWVKGREQWMEAWPSGTRCDVRCLDGGAWDRSTSWGMFGTLEEALKCAKGDRPWGRKP